jgi:hypothetical protein
MDPSILILVVILWVGAMFWLFAPSLKEQPLLAALPMLACILLPPLGLLLLVIAIPGRWDDYRRGTSRPR